MRLDGNISISLLADCLSKITNSQVYFADVRYACTPVEADILKNLRWNLPLTYPQAFGVVEVAVRLRKFGFDSGYSYDCCNFSRGGGVCAKRGTR